jgi:hypothetical protein
VGYVYKESCHIVNLAVSERQSLLLWPSWGECPSIFWNSLKMATARAKAMHRTSAIVHCDCGYPKSGGENVHTANTAERNVAQDKAPKPAEMVGSVHTAKTAERNVAQDEAPKPAEIVDFAGYNFAGYYHDASKRLNAIIDDHGSQCHALQMQTIMDEVDKLDNNERMTMIQNLLHLNQVSPIIMANMVYSDKYQSKDNHPGQSFYLMERPISNVILTGTPIEEHVERFMTDEDKKALPIRNTAKIGPKWPNKDEYRRLVRQTKCEHCKVPWRISFGPPLSCKGDLEGQWTCLECAEMVETGYYCTMGGPLYVFGTVVPSTQTDRINMFTDYEE